jgi:hypothetical protein
MAILRIGGARPPKGVRRGVSVAEPRPHLAEREPGRGETGRKLDRLRIEVGGAGKVAALFKVLGELERSLEEMKSCIAGYLSARADTM